MDPPFHPLHRFHLLLPNPLHRLLRSHRPDRVHHFEHASPCFSIPLSAWITCPELEQSLFLLTLLILLSQSSLTSTAAALLLRLQSYLRRNLLQL